MNDNTTTSLIKQTTPESSALDSLKALVHRNIDMLEYVQGRIEDDEDLLEFIDAIVDRQYAALNEHVAIQSTWIGRYNQRRIAEAGYLYDDESPVREHFESKGLTSTYYPRYDGNRDLAQARHYKSVADMNLRFVEEMEARAEGREWPSADEANDQGQDGSSTDL